MKDQLATRSHKRCGGKNKEIWTKKNPANQISCFSVNPNENSVEREKKYCVRWRDRTWCPTWLSCRVTDCSMEKWTAEWRLQSSQLDCNPFIYWIFVLKGFYWVQIGCILLFEWPHAGSRYKWMVGVGVGGSLRCKRHCVLCTLDCSHNRGSPGRSPAPAEHMVPQPDSVLRCIFVCSL